MAQKPKVAVDHRSMTYMKEIAKYHDTTVTAILEEIISFGIANHDQLTKYVGTKYPPSFIDEDAG